MAQLHEENILLDARVDVGAEQPLEERLVLGKTANSCELVLEEAPDVVGLQTDGLLLGQQDLRSEDLIILLRVFVP